MGLDQDIETIRANLKVGRFTNEAAVRQGVVLPLLQALGWPTIDTQIVFPEYPLDGKRADFALCYPPSKPLVFVEVKNIGQSDGAEWQLFEYAFRGGVQLVVLTDGQTWSFFLPGEHGSIGERRVYKLDLVERDGNECAERLLRYLEYEAVKTEKAIELARQDYRNYSRERRAREMLPHAWENLLYVENEELRELLADRVEIMCGYRPEPDVVLSFLRARVLASTPSNGTGAIFTHVQPASPAPPRSVPHQPPGGYGFWLHGQHFPARSAIDALEKILEELARRDPAFPARFAALPSHGRTRKYLARIPEQLNPKRPDLARDFSKQLTFGWWLDRNLNNQVKQRIIEMACDAAGISYGTDLRVELG